VFENIRHDWARYASGAGPRQIPSILLTQGLWASTEHRFGHWARTAAPGWSRLFLLPVSVVTHLVIEAVAGISIHPRATIGPGLYIGHFGGVIVNKRAVLGAGCTLSQEVTIGQDVNPPFGAPSIGRGVFFGPGAKVLGEITIGNHVAIGANAVVRESLPDRAIAVGVPARVVRIQDPHEVNVAEIART
jgi:serine O-acetyltransferase